MVLQTGWGAMHLCCFDGQTPLVKILLDAGADINLENVHGQTPLLLATKNARYDILLMLLDNDEVEVNTAMASGTTALHTACLNGDYHAVKALLTHGADVFTERTSEGHDGIQPLHDACTVGDVDSVEALLEAGADANALMGNYFSPLHQAAKGGHVAVIELLLSRDVETRGRGLDQRGGNVHAVHVATECDQPDALEALLKGGAQADVGRMYHGRAGVTPLQLAALRDHGRVAEVLIKHGVDIDARDEDGVSAVHHAARHGHKNMMQLLIEAGADINAGACSAQAGTQTPLHLAVRAKHMDIVKLLITAGAQVSMAEQMRYETTTGHEHDDEDDDASVVETTLDGYTALHWAAENGDLPMVRLLLASNSPINAPSSFESNHGVTPLHLASQDGHAQIVNELLKYEHCYRDPLKNTSDRSSITPLHQAAYNGHLDTVKALIEHGADVSRKTDNGYTSLHYAAQQGHTDIARELIEADVELNAMATLNNQANITALHLAVQNDATDLVALLLQSGCDVSIGKSTGKVALYLWFGSHGHLQSGFHPFDVSEYAQ